MQRIKIYKYIFFINLTKSNRSLKFNNIVGTKYINKIDKINGKFTKLILKPL